MKLNQTRTYHRASSVVFLKTNEAFGGLSNMAGGFSLSVNGFQIRTSEALYQACRFPHLPEVQRLIIKQKSPMTAKMKSKPHRKSSRSDWNRVRVKVMRWCLRAKLAQNWVAFSELLLETADRPIIEQSRKDDFWGAKPTDEDTLVGRNVLGRLLMELREEVKVENGASLLRVDPLTIPDFLLSGSPIEVVSAGDAVVEGGMEHVSTQSSRKQVDNPMVMQTSLLYEPAAEETRLLEYPPVKKADVRIVNLKPYPEMKDSGVAWLGDVPAHWEVRRLKYLLHERDVRSADGSEQLLRVSQYTGVSERKSEYGTDIPDTRASSLVGYRCVSSNDLVVNIMLAWNGSMGVSDFSGIASPAYCVYKFNNNAVPRYFHNLLRSPIYKVRIKAVSTGVVESRLRLYTDDLYRLEGLLPPLPEQAAIVRYLDYVENRIQRYVQSKRKLLGLLAEQKQAIIHRAVTRGLDLDVPLKPSGVEWLGEVPAHWDVVAIKRRYSIQLGKMLQNRAIESTDVEVPYLKAQHVQWFSVRTADAPKMWASQHDIEQFGVRVGDLLVCEGGEGGRCGLIRESLRGHIIQNALHRLRPLRGSSNNYLEYVLSSTASTGWFNAINNKATIAHFTKEKCGSLESPFPPIHEQTTIVEYLDKITARIDAVIARTHREIELISEYRTRLIADVVTGKVDVREAAAKLPDEADDLMPDSDADDTLDPDTTFDEVAELDMVAEPGRKSRF